MQYWIFDLDGTLTIPKHNFLEIKKQLNIPIQQDILKTLDQLDSPEKEIKYKLLDEIEKQVAKETEMNMGVYEFLLYLKQRFKSEFAILTRNTKENAMITLSAINLLSFFEDEFILGRDDSEAKPSPEGINKILSKWNCNPADVFMVGDYIYDLKAGRNAGAKTILINQVNNSDWSAYYDFVFKDFIEAIDHFFSKS